MKIKTKFLSLLLMLLITATALLPVIYGTTRAVRATTNTRDTVIVFSDTTDYK